MKVSHYSKAEATLEVPGVLKRVVIGAEDGAPNFCMRVFDVEPGSSTPYHTHPWEHEVFVLSGRGVVVDAGKKETEVSGKTVVYVAPDEPHCFTNIGADTLRFICLIPNSAQTDVCNTE